MDNITLMLMKMNNIKTLRRDQPDDKVQRCIDLLDYIAMMSDIELPQEEE